jgi:hypothetical protein
MITTALQNLAMLAQKDSNAETYFTRSYDLNQKAFGENSQGETIYGQADNRLAIPWTSLCAVYDPWGKAEKSASCHAHLVTMAEKQFGPDSPYLVPARQREEMERQIADVERFRSGVRQANTFLLDPTL